MWLYIQAILTIVWKYIHSSVADVFVHPGVSKYCVVVRKKAILANAWVYIQTSLIVVRLYIQEGPSVLWLYIQASLTVVWL